MIDLGSFGQLIAPIQVEGKWYYYLDINKDGVQDGFGTSDHLSHTTLNTYFNQTLEQLGSVSTTPGGTTDLVRYATINNVKLALPTYGGPLDGTGKAAPLQGFNTSQNDTNYLVGSTTTSARDATANSNPTYNDMLAIWDGNGTGNVHAGAPLNWNAYHYWTATPTGSTYVYIGMDSGYVVNNEVVGGLKNIALQVL